MEAKGVGAARAVVAKAVAAHRWASPVARPVKEPSVVAARAATRVAVTKAAVARVAGLVAPRAVVAAGTAMVAVMSTLAATTRISTFSCSTPAALATFCRKLVVSG